jgi:hypothetical protein
MSESRGLLDIAVADGATPLKVVSEPPSEVAVREVHLGEVTTTIVALSAPPPLRKLLANVALKWALLLVFTYTLYIRTLDYRAELIVIRADDYVHFAMGSTPPLAGNVTGVRCNSWECDVHFVFPPGPDAPVGAAPVRGVCDWDCTGTVPLFAFKRWLAYFGFLWTVMLTDALNMFLLTRRQRFLVPSSLWLGSVLYHALHPAPRPSKCARFCEFLLRGFLLCLAACVGALVGPELNLCAVLLRAATGAEPPRNDWLAALHYAGLVARVTGTWAMSINTSIYFLLTTSGADYICLLNAPPWQLSVLVQTFAKMFVFWKSMQVRCLLPLSCSCRSFALTGSSA